jgi:hypothetical protein
MGEAQFKDVATRITGLFETCGTAAAIAAQERLNQTLKRKDIYIRFRGRPNGRHLAFRLYRSDTRPHQVVFVFMCGSGWPRRATLRQFGGFTSTTFI